ncbi:RxLR effector protein [Phytophthora megakarya]|uniref:RxLR effector protein n=1 Tax=Phytophthora megakarya TaxID=4795 RepID=A0A225WIL2_9STRA|nr:RxLR effector protein [Phytophthora megakarya]
MYLSLQFRFPIYQSLLNSPRKHNMRIISFLVLFVTICIVSDVYVTRAEEKTSNTMVNPASDTASFSEVHRLRGSPNVKREERWVPPVGAYMNLLQQTSKTSTQSSQIVHVAVKNTPLPKRVKVLIILLGLSLTAGTIAGGIKIADILTNVLDKSGSK